MGDRLIKSLFLADVVEGSMGVYRDAALRLYFPMKQVVQLSPVSKSMAQAKQWLEAVFCAMYLRQLPQEEIDALRSEVFGAELKDEGDSNGDGDGNGDGNGDGDGDVSGNGDGDEDDEGEKEGDEDGEGKNEDDADVEGGSIRTSSNSCVSLIGCDESSDLSSLPLLTQISSDCRFVLSLSHFVFASLV